MSLGKKTRLPRKPTTPPAAAFTELREVATVVEQGNWPVRLLDLTAEEREALQQGKALEIDAAGRECFRGLNIAESLEFLALRRVGLDNDDRRFLKLVQLGDQHEAALKRFVDC